MPTIKEYDAGNLALRPTETGTDARLQAARRIGAFANQAAGAITSAAEAGVTAAGDVAKSASGVAGAVETALQQQEDYAGHRAISQGAADGLKLKDRLEDKWNAQVADAAKRDPNDPTVKAKFMEQELEPALQDFKDAYGGTDLGAKWAEQFVQHTRQHFDQKSSADMMTLAGKAVEVNVQQLRNTSANNAFKNPDFHNVDFLIGNVSNSIDAMVGSSNVKGAESIKLRTDLTEKTKDQIVKSAAAGAIAKSADPEATAKAFAERYPQYLSGADTQAFARAAKAQAKANTLADRQIGIAERQEADRAVHAASAKLMNDYVSTDPVTGQVMIKPGYFNAALDIARNNPNAPSAAAQVHAQITWGEHQQTQKAQATISDPAVKSDLLSRMFDPANPTSEIDLMRANVAGKLSTHDFAAMHQLQKTLEDSPLKGEVMKDTLAAAKAALTYSMPGMPGRDPKGLANYSAFIQSFVPKYIGMSRAGTLPANALDTRDPASLISQSMAPFKRSAKQLIDDRVQEMSTLGDTNLTGPNKSDTGQQVIDIPAGMSIPAAVKKYGSGKTVKLPDGRTKVLP